MATYSTFFVCMPDELPTGFRGWQPPLPAPVRREIRDFLTGKVIMIETREPEWTTDDIGEADDELPTVDVTRIDGNYQDYLEERLPAFVAARPHWCAKDLTEVELNPLGPAAGFESAVVDALYGPPSAAGIIQRFRPELILKLASLDETGRAAVADKWAETLSGPEHTHSGTGIEVQAGCDISEARAMLDEILQIVNTAPSEAGLYVLIEW